MCVWVFFYSSGSINNIHKVYKEKNGVVEALRGDRRHFSFFLQLDVKSYLPLQKYPLFRFQDVAEC